jgi:hypothetical protein
MFNPTGISIRTPKQGDDAEYPNFWSQQVLNSKSHSVAELANASGGPLILDETPKVVQVRILPEWLLFFD